MTAAAVGQSVAWTVTMLMIFSAVCALMTLALQTDVACPAATANSAGSEDGRLQFHGDGDVAIECFGHAWHDKSGIRAFPVVATPEAGRRGNPNCP